MINKIEIRDKKGGVLSVTLKELLRATASQGQYLNWYILDLEAVGVLTGGLPMLDLMERIANEQNAYRIGWRELTLFADEVHQVINGLFAGCGEPTVFSGSLEMEELEGFCDMVIGIFDSSFCRVFAKDSKVIDVLREEYSDVRLL